MFETTIAGSLPKPFWLAETDKLWPAWKATGAELEKAKRDATLLWLKEQEDAGLDIVEHGMYGYPETFIPAPEIGAASTGPAAPAYVGGSAATVSAMTATPVEVTR